MALERTSSFRAKLINQENDLLFYFSWLAELFLWNREPFSQVLRAADSLEDLAVGKQITNAKEIDVVSEMLGLRPQWLRNL